MKIALASKKFINNDIDFNLNVILKSMDEVKQKNVEILCFGESFLQGFDALSWDNYESDLAIALEKDSDVIKQISTKSKVLSLCVMFGYIEKEFGKIYSSYLVIDKGEIIHNYRRISKGWKEYSKTNDFYCEGKEVPLFKLEGHDCAIALCGDLYSFPERFRVEEEILIWPVYLNFSMDEWNNVEKAEYERIAGNTCRHVLWINSLSDNPDAYGGCYYFKEGKIEQALELGMDGIMIAEVSV